MEKSGVKPVLGALPQVEEWRGLGEVVEGKGETELGGLGGVTGDRSLDGLAGEGPDDVESDGCGDPPAELDEDKALGGVGEGKLEVSAEGAEQRGEVLEGERFGAAGKACAQGTIRGEDQGGTLKPAGAVGDVVGEEGVGEVVEFVDPMRFAVGGADPRERGVGELAEVCQDPAFETGAAGDFAMLTRGFESAGMGESTGGKGGVEELPELPGGFHGLWALVIHRFHRLHGFRKQRLYPQMAQMAQIFWHVDRGGLPPTR